jgi:hypothetical protein
VTARLRYLALTAARTRAALPPLAATLFAAIGVYAYPENEPRATFAVTALMACGLSAWAVGAVLAGEPEPQAEMASVALGGRSERTGLEVMFVGAVSAGVTIVFLAYPLALVALGVPKVFSPPVQGDDIAAGVIAHLCCAALGGTVGVLYAPPRLTRRATAIAAVLATLLALIAAASVLGPVGGPVAVASALSDAGARSSALDGAVVVGCLSCLVLAAGAVAAADRWARRTG